MKPQRNISSHPCSSNSDDGFVVSFDAMASPCELLMETTDESEAIELGTIVAQEAWRIEDKYSRYNPNSLLSELNQQAGKVCKIDEETFQLFAFANHCYELSDGLFDITSGVLRKIWRFDGSDNIPNQSQVNQLLPQIGWNKIQFSNNFFKMAPSMEIDLGGLGKEYAVDSCIKLLKTKTSKPVLVNFGGDLAVNGSRQNDQPWRVGIEHPGSEQQPLLLSINTGAIATSGDAKRFLLKNGTRYSHILNAKNGWPIQGSPKSLTVAAPQCIQAGFIATLGLLQGAQCEQFLNSQEITYWCIK